MTQTATKIPTISVLMPVYNAAAYLREAMASILGQSYADFEFICVDDGSTDSSPAILREYAAQDARVVILTKPNGGVTSALNTGLTIACGEFVARMDADDVADTDRFEAQIAYMRAHSDVVAVGCRVTHMTTQGVDIMLSPLYDTHEQIAECLWNGNSTAMPHFGSFIRRSSLTQIGNYREEFRTAQDLDLFLRLSEIGKLGNVPRSLVRYRVHEKSVGALKGDEQARNAREILRQAYARRGLKLPRHLATWTNLVTAINRNRWAWQALEEGRFADARSYALLVLRRQPFSPGNWKLAMHALLGPWCPAARSAVRRLKRLIGREPQTSSGGSPMLNSAQHRKVTIAECAAINEGPSSIPQITVLMPLFNTERHLPAAIESVLAQTFTDFQIIAVDDGSTDATLCIIQQYAARDSRIRVIRRPHTGIVGALNEGLALSQTEFVARMDGDDLCLPDRFEKQVAYLRQHPDCVLVGSQVLLIDPDGAAICPHHLTRFTHEQIDHDHLNRGWPIVHPAVLMRRKVVEQIGGYREQYEWLEDLDIFLRLAEVGKLANLPDILLKYRLHFQSVCHMRREIQAPLKEKLCEETRRRRGMTAPATTDIPPSVLSEKDLHQLWAWWALQAGNASTARKHALKTLRKAPFSKESWRVMACAVRGH